MELSEEENIAIETLKEVASDDFDTLGDDISPKMAQNILNVIENQQKEIEEKTTIIMAGAEKVKQLEKEIEALEIIHTIYKEMIEENNYISKDKIREKIKELETLYNCNLDTAMTSYEMFVFVRSYIDKVKNCLNEL